MRYNGSMQRHSYTRKLAANVFVVRRRSRAGRHYLLVTKDGGVTCSCEAYEHDAACHAMKAVAARLLRNRPEMLAAVGLSEKVRP
jgi:hypothetical protein